MRASQCFAGPAERAAPGRRLGSPREKRGEWSAERRCGFQSRHGRASLHDNRWRDRRCHEPGRLRRGVLWRKDARPSALHWRHFRQKAKPPPRRPVRASGTGAAPVTVLRAPRGAAVVPPGRSPAPPGCRACEARRAGPRQTKASRLRPSAGVGGQNLKPQGRISGPNPPPIRSASRRL